MKVIIVDGFEYLIDEKQKVIGLVTEDRETIQICIKPNNKLHKWLQ